MVAVPIDSELEVFLQKTARKLSRLGRYHGYETEDLLQEFRIHLQKKFSQFDVTLLNWSAFARLIIVRLARQWKRHWRTHKLSHMQMIQFSQWEKLPGWKPDEKEALTRRHQMRLDVALVIGALPMELRVVAKGMMISSQVELAQRLGLSRDAIRNRLKRMRYLFEKNYLREYL